MYIQEHVSNVDMYTDDTTIYDINKSKENVKKNCKLL